MVGQILLLAGQDQRLTGLPRVTGKPSIIQRASVGRQFSGRATPEEAERVRHERKPFGAILGSGRRGFSWQSLNFALVHRRENGAASRSAMKNFPARR